MANVSVVEVGHERDADDGECECGELLEVGPPLVLVQVRPDHVVDDQGEEEGGVRGGEVQDEALLVDGWKIWKKREY